MMFKPNILLQKKSRLMPGLWIVLSVALITGCANNASTDKSAGESVSQASAVDKKGKQAPDFTLKDLSGKEYKLADFRGKYVFLDFWGTWCGPCISALPKIREAYAKVDKSKIEFIGICVDCDDLKEFAKKNDLPWIQLLDDNGNVADKFSVKNYPTPMLIDPNGKIVEEGISDIGYTRFEQDLMGVINSHVK